MTKNGQAVYAPQEFHASYSVALYPPERKRLYRFGKRLLDILCGTFGLLLLLPLFLVVAIAIKLDSKGAVFYRQMRVGHRGRLFKIAKFRSMCSDADQKLAELEALNERDGPAFKIENDPRTTRVGRFIRKTCIDELPQLWNILKGDMSLVGPRPPLPKEVAMYTAHQMRRLDVVPGLTCYWQVKKGERTSFDEWVDMDIKYIRERGLLTDLKIVLMTFQVVFSGKGAL